MNRMLKGIAVVAGLLFMIGGAWGQEKAYFTSYNRKKSISLKMTKIDTQDYGTLIGQAHGDMNNDGRMDTITLITAGSLFQYLRNADNTYVKRKIAEMQGTYMHGININDFNLDNNLDIMVANTSGQVFFIKGNGNGTYEEPVMIVNDEYIRIVSLDSYTVHGKKDITLTAITANGERYEIKDINWIISQYVKD